MNAGLLVLLMAQNNLRHTQQMLSSQSVDINNNEKKEMKKEYEPKHEEKDYISKHTNEHEKIISI